MSHTAEIECAILMHHLEFENAMASTNNNDILEPVLYRWSVHDTYLISVLAPDMRVVDVKPAEPARSALERILGAASPPSLVIVHIDASIPAQFVRPLDELNQFLIDRGIEVWNCRVDDIRKSVVQAHNERLGLPSTRASHEGPLEELLIVKTNLNSRGCPEWSLSPETRQALGWPPPKESPLHGTSEYLVMPRGRIPANWWLDDQAAIERYVDNRYGLFYRAYFSGEAVVICEGTANTKVRRMRDADNRYDFLLSRDLAIDEAALSSLETPAAEVFCAAVVYAETLGLDYGSIDFVVDDGGVPYVIDVNPTPYWGSSPGDGEMLRHLRQGFGPCGYQRADAFGWFA